ncbi:hypothetical protein [Geitlerinema sp. P-1104]|uniref:hypothetical protein n=1 Tax=Geitlerinema sp. P-1104 TaxID=2546230 RepID=UPI001476EEE0|nr:hypothetical protein [Geitlerinema sp. P-1104]
MTELLERAIARLQTLSESEQNAIAAIILEEIEDGSSGFRVIRKIYGRLHPLL